MTEEPFELTDEMVAAKWAEVADLIEVVTARIENPDDFVVQPSSQLAADDIATSPYHVSHCARWCLNSGVDHLHALKSLIVDAGRIHSSAPYSLVRGALENLAAGFWLLHPSEPNVRIERGLRWWAKNFKDEDGATRDRNLASYKPLKPKLQTLVGLAQAAQFDTTRIREGFTSTAALVYANDHSSAKNPHLVWQLCSGFAHGRPWAFLAINERRTRSTSADGVSLVRFTTDHRRILAVTMPAMHLLTDLLRLYQERSQVAVNSCPPGRDLPSRGHGHVPKTP